MRPTMNFMFSIRFLKFLAVGGSGAVGYILGSYILTVMGMRAWIASFVVYVCLISIVYFVQRKFVFESGVVHSKSFPRYVAVQLIGLFLSAVLPFFMETIGINPLVSFVSVAFVAACASYVLQLRWVFRDDRQSWGKYEVH
jgi:putative flippase GtrA